MAKKKIEQEEKTFVITNEEVQVEERKYIIGDIFGIQYPESYKPGLLDVFKGLVQLKDTEPGAKFSYWVNKNISKLLSITESIHKKYPLVFSSKFSYEAHQEFNALKNKIREELMNKDMELQQKYGLKGEDGEYVMNNRKVVIGDEEAYNNEMMEFNKDAQLQFEKYKSE